MPAAAARLDLANQVVSARERCLVCWHSVLVEQIPVSVWVPYPFQSLAINSVDTPAVYRAFRERHFDRRRFQNRREIWRSRLRVRGFTDPGKALGLRGRLVKFTGESECLGQRAPFVRKATNAHDEASGTKQCIPYFVLLDAVYYMQRASRTDGRLHVNRCPAQIKLVYVVFLERSS